jgi:hypothetical protein
MRVDSDDLKRTIAKERRGIIFPENLDLKDYNKVEEFVRPILQTYQTDE